MLQYILNESEQYSIAQLCQMAIEGGCMWINIACPKTTDDQLRAALVPDVVSLCRETGTILTIDDRPELAGELGLHGVRFTAKYFLTHQASPMQLREQLGPEAMIGIETADPSALGAMAEADVDFACIPAKFSADDRVKFLKAIDEAGVQLPIVAQGEINVVNASQFMAEGFNGLAVGDAITNSPDPAAVVEAIIDAISA